MGKRAVSGFQPSPKTCGFEAATPLVIDSIVLQPHPDCLLSAAGGLIGMGMAFPSDTSPFPLRNCFLARPRIVNILTGII